MNIIFDKKTLRVVSLFESSSITDNEEQVLKNMYPSDYKKMGIWSIAAQIDKNPIHLKVEVDKDKDPSILKFKGEVLYEASPKEKEAKEKKKMEVRRKAIEQKVSKSLLRSVNNEMLKLWMSSRLTETSICQSLRNFEYFSDKELLPISWWGPFTDAGGYANMNREIMFRLHNHHVVVKAEI